MFKNLLLLLSIIFIIFTTGCKNKNVNIDDTKYTIGTKMEKIIDGDLIYADQRKQIIYFGVYSDHFNLRYKTVVLDSNNYILRIYNGYKDI